MIIQGIDYLRITSALDSFYYRTLTCTILSYNACNVRKFNGCVPKPSIRPFSFKDFIINLISLTNEKSIPIIQQSFGDSSISNLSEPIVSEPT